MLGVGAAGILLVLVPWTVRNLAAFDGELVPLTDNSGSVARGANCDAAFRGPYEGLWVTNVSLDGTEGDPARAGCFSGFDLLHGELPGLGPPRQNEAKAAALLRADGTAYAKAHKGELPRVMAARLGRTVGLYRFDQQRNSEQPQLALQSAPAAAAEGEPQEATPEVQADGVTAEGEPRRVRERRPRRRRPALAEGGPIDPNGPQPDVGDLPAFITAGGTNPAE